MSSIAARTDRTWELNVRAKLSRTADKRGEVVVLRVERALGTQDTPPPIQQIQRSTSWRFGNLEKSKDCSKPSPSSTLQGDNISVNIEPAWLGGGLGFTMEAGHVRYLHKALGTSFYEPHSREEALVRAFNIHFGKM